MPPEPARSRLRAVRLRRLGFKALLALVFVAAVMLAAPPDARACMGHYRSTLSLVADSPLIVIGHVAHVDSETAGEAARRGDTPQVATVKVRRVLKGRYQAPTLLIRSGPIGSCSPVPVHYELKPASDRIFVLPSNPTKGEVSLAYGGSVLDLDSLLLVESRLERFSAYATAYLRDAERREPKKLEQARQLAAKMRTLKDGWPSQRPATGRPTKEHRERFVEADKGLVATLAPFDIEVIRMAIALDWASDEPDRWLVHELWKSAMWRIVRVRSKDYLQAERRRLARALKRIGVSAELSEEYLATIDERQVSARLTFPPPPPRIDNDASASVATTSFLLEFHAFDRGEMAMYFMYGKLLGRLDAKRLHGVIPAMLRSDDDRLRRLATKVVEATAGGAAIPTRSGAPGPAGAEADESLDRKHGDCADAWTQKEGGTSCKPYLCIAGRCETRCDYDSECDSRHQCRSNRCEPIAAVEVTADEPGSSGCACVLPGRSDARPNGRRHKGSGAASWLSALLVLLIYRARRDSSPRKP